jgi:hypothetical protein
MGKAIIVIGFDDTGKTTLVEYLHHRISLSMCVKSPGPVSREDQLKYITDGLQSERPIIMERCPAFDELVYGTVLRGKSNFEYKDDVWGLIKVFDPLIIYCRPSDRSIFNFGEREQYEGVIENSIELLEEWDKTFHLIQHSGFRVFKYNWESDESQMLLDVIINHINKGEIK